jgi:hypothetical protein
MEKITIAIGYNHMRKDIRAIREKLCEISEAEATKLYRLAWRMEEHGCSAENVAKVREEARELHMNAYPERLLDPFRVWAYAFKF